MIISPPSAHSATRRCTRNALICAAALLVATAATAQTRSAGSAPEALQVAPASNLQTPDSRATQPPAATPQPAANSAQASGDNGLRLAPGSKLPQPQPQSAAAQSTPAGPDPEAIVHALTGAEPLQPPRGIARTGYWQANGYWLAPLLIVIVLAATATGIILYRRSRRPIVLSPQLIALQAIRNAEAHAEDKLFAIAVSDAVRSYLEARFQLRATEQTTEEFLQSAPQSSHLPPEAVDALARLLKLCDLAKFARQGLSPAQRSELSQSAQQLIGSLGQPQTDGVQNQTAGSAQ